MRTAGCWCSTGTTPRENTGHGSPLPQLVHGGPGRAGGGEELGGIRGVLHYMQRTAVQGSPDMLTAIAGRWVTGAQRNDDGVHPFRKWLAELRIGDSVTAGPRAVTLEDIEHFAEFTGDTFYAHMDEAAAARQPVLRRPRRARLPGRVAGGRACSSTRTRVRCWPTTASRTCASSRRSIRGTSSRSR